MISLINAGVVVFGIHYITTLLNAGAAIFVVSATFVVSAIDDRRYYDSRRCLAWGVRPRPENIQNIRLNEAPKLANLVIATFLKPPRPPLSDRICPKGGARGVRKTLLLLCFRPWGLRGTYYLLCLLPRGLPGTTYLPIIYYV